MRSSIRKLFSLSFIPQPEWSFWNTNQINHYSSDFPPSLGFKILQFILIILRIVANLKKKTWLIYSFFLYGYPIFHILKLCSSHNMLGFAFLELPYYWCICVCCSYFGLHYSFPSSHVTNSFASINGKFSNRVALIWKIYKLNFITTSYN